MTASRRPPLLVATDLDGTLLRSDGTVSPRTRAALGALERSGIPVIFVTARPPRWLDDLADVVGEHGLAICANGAIVYDVARRQVVSTQLLSAESALAVVEALRAGLPGTVFASEHADGFVKEPDFHEDGGPRGGVATGRIETLFSPLPGKLLARNEKLVPDEFIARATRIVGGLAEVHVSGATGLVEISAQGVTKAAALADWCSARDVDAADVWAFGDMPNDLPMLAWAGTSFAVANAHRDVLALATERCASNDDDGVARILETVPASNVREESADQPAVG